MDTSSDSSVTDADWKVEGVGAVSEPTFLSHVLIPMWLTWRRASIATRIDAITRRREVDDKEESLQQGNDAEAVPR